MIADMTPISSRFTRSSLPAVALFSLCITSLIVTSQTSQDPSLRDLNQHQKLPQARIKLPVNTLQSISLNSTEQSVVSSQFGRTLLSTDSPKKQDTPRIPQARNPSDYSHSNHDTSKQRYNLEGQTQDSLKFWTATPTEGSRQDPSPSLLDDDSLEPPSLELTKSFSSQPLDMEPLETGYSIPNNPKHSAIHPLLIYSMRFEIRCHDLFNIFTPETGISYIGRNLSTRSHIEQLNNHHTPRHSKSLIGGLKNTIGLDFYYSNNESFIFWTDVIEERIYKGTISDGSIANVDTVVQTGLATAEGLAIDWIAKNIYWVESTLDHIEVSKMNGSFRRTLIAGDMESPRAIAVDPRYGFLFWTDWDKKSPRIERATMAGDDRRVLVHIKEVKGGWPNGLTLDYDQLKIYWIDASSDSIHVVDYDGKNPKDILKNIKSLGHPFSITLFENNLFWTDWKTNSISMANKLNGSEAKELQRLNTRLFDIKVFHPSRQPKMENSLNPCFINNGNCSHLCLLSLDHTRKCECPNLMKLSSDQLTCESDENVLFIGRANEIRAVDIDKPVRHLVAPISLPKVFNPRQFAFDSKSKTIFWVDSQTNEVKKSQIVGNSIETIMDVIIDSPTGLALDWISGTIYVTSAPQQKSPGKIYISNLNGEYISVLMDFNQGVIAPKSLAVHPVLGLLFCLDENENGEPIIFVAGMNGKNKMLIASKLINPKLENPSNLAIDYDSNKVYWVNQAVGDSTLASVQYYDILLDKIITILDESLVTQEQRFNPGVLCVDGDNLIMSGRFPTEVIVRASKHNITNRVIHKTQSTDQILALTVFNATSQFGTNACSYTNGNCSQLCVPTNSTHRTCKCTIGFNTNPNNETECIGKDLFLIFSNNLGMRGISLDPNDPSHEHYLPPIHKAFRASSIDYVHKDNLIYWVDNEEGSIIRINRDTTNYQVIVQGLESEESIAIDWVAGNIYWLDPYYDIIEVARLNGSNRYVIVSGDMDKANSIMVNPIKGYLVWSDVGSFPKIETANLDGSNRKVIVSKNITHIDDLAIDYVDDYIYWVDSSQAIIERIRSDGTGRQNVYSYDTSQGNHNHLVYIAIYKEYLFFADPVLHNGSIIRCNKNMASNTSNHKILQKSLGDGIRDISIYATQPMPKSEENPCVQNNGGCQDLCTFMGKPGLKRCLCSHGRLKSDGLTCESYDAFALFSKLSQIESIHIKDDESLNNAPYAPIAIESRSSIISLTVDYESRRVIYSEITHDQICSMYFNGTDRRVLVERQSLVEGISFSNNQLYWTSIHDNSISRLNTTSFGKLPQCEETKSCGRVEKLVRLSSEDKPRGIAIDSCTDYIYWTNWNNEASIQRASPKNDYEVESIIKTNIKVPNGIAIDQKQRKLYWCDARLDKIETCDMDGTNRIILISATPQHPFAVAIWENYVFWTDWLARGVFKADKYTGERVTQIKKVVKRPMGIAIAVPDIHRCPIDLCMSNNGGCPPDKACKMLFYIGKVECIPRQLVIDMKPIGRNPTAIKTYHDLMMSIRDKYNPSELINMQPIAGSSIYIDSTSESSPRTDSTTQLMPRTSSDLDNQFSYNDTYTRSRPSLIQETTQSVGQTPASNISTISPEISLNNASSTSSTTSDSKDIIVTSSSSIVNTMANPVKIIPNNSSSNVSSQITKSATIAPTMTHQTAEVTTEKIASKPSKSTISDKSTTLPNHNTPQAVANNTTPTVLPPCQIVPAALQPTTDSSEKLCEHSGDFRCYLSEKLLCISGSKRCDGSFDCPSKEDENDCYLSKRGPYNLKHETDWHRFVPVMLIILAAAIAGLFLVFGPRGRRRWFVSNNGAFNHRRMFDDNGTNIEISNPMFDEDDSNNLAHCAFSIDLNERTTNFSNPLYERQVLLMNDTKHVTSN